MKNEKSNFLGNPQLLFLCLYFFLNRSMNLSGGHWLWGAILRYIFMLPMLAILLFRNRGMEPVIKYIVSNSGKWLLWSTVGFGFFYAPLSAAAIYAESWFTAALWQLTIVAVVLLAPISVKGFL